VIERLAIQNVRSFEGQHAIDLEPITMLYGPNSAGKSTIIQSLLALKQTLVSADASGPTAPVLRLRGDDVDLGDFTTFVHRHNKALPLTLNVATRNHPIGDRPTRVASYGLGATFVQDDDGVHAPESTLVSDDTTLRFHRGPQLEHFAVTEPRSLIALIDNWAADVERDPGKDEEVKRKTRDWRASVAEQINALQELRFLAVPGQHSLFPAIAAPQFDEPDTDFRFGIWYDDMRQNCLGSVLDALRRLVYLGPMRVAPTRFQQLSRDGTSDVGSRGQHTTRLLRDKQLQTEVNIWLKHLEIPYELSVSELGAPAGDVVVTRLADTRPAHDDARAPLLLTPQDVGYGVSQLLPVIVQLLAPGRSTTCIEQPELHIHPRLQARLADLFILAASRGKQVIVETHSEAFMLRLQNRIRFDQLAAGDISVWYVFAESDAPASTLVPLPIDSDGSWHEEWPDGFFAERFHEITAETCPPIPLLQ
jgi:AAA domain, putative AbiEii toxin, Type IV TA system/AAA domain